VCLPDSLTTCTVQDVAKPSIKSHCCLPHRVHGCCDLCLSLHIQLAVSIYCLLNERYGIVPYCSLVLCQPHCLVDQHYLAVRVEGEPFSEAAHVYLIVSPIILVATATFPVRSGRLVVLWVALLIRIGKLLWGPTGLFDGGRWWGCTGLFLSGRWRGRTSIVFAG
jgi:hypothetical protein